jgi:thiol-disulfide isomerase/thioredoxin/Ca2+-binding EF-hand superfamily protein
MTRMGLIGVAILVSGSLAFGQEPPRQAVSRPKPAEVLEKAWPDHPEWVAMLVDILQGSQLGPGEGWFKKAVAQTRFTWDATRKALDKDGDGSISRSEFGGKDADFARLDRDRDGVLTEPDFDFSPHALTPSPGMMLFYASDRDGNGKVSREEFEGVFRALDSGGQGFLSQDDLRRAFAPPAARPKSPTAPPSASGPSKWTLVKGLFRQEIGSLQPGPKLDEVAPDFSLLTVDGQDGLTLSKKIGPKPVVLIFGNFTCGPFRSQSGNIEKLYQRYKDRATFVMVYVREAHPTDGWSMESNDRVGVTLRQPRTYEERVAVARKCVQTLNFGFPTLVDTIDDQVGARYSGMPGRFYLIDPEGKVAYKSGRGPFGFKPAELEQSLVMLLRQTEKTEPSPGTKPLGQ